MGRGCQTIITIKIVAPPPPPHTHRIKDVSLDALFVCFSLLFYNYYHIHAFVKSLLTKYLLY